MSPMFPAEPFVSAPARAHGLVAAFGGPEPLRLALEELYSAGVPAGVVTVLGSGEPPHGGVRAPESIAELAEELVPLPRETLLGSLAGAYAGLWGSLLLLAVPGFGPAVVAGGQALLMAEGAASVAAGAGLGALLSGLLKGRHEEHHRVLWEQLVASGGWLLIVHGTEAEYDEAHRVLKRHAPTHVDHFLQ